MLAARAFSLSCSRLRLWILSWMSLVMFSLVTLRLLKDPGYLASRFRRFLAEIRAREFGVPFFRLIVGAELSSEDDMAAIGVTIMMGNGGTIITPQRHPCPRRPTTGRCSRIQKPFPNLGL